jgi:hypothetical protein
VAQANKNSSIAMSNIKESNIKERDTNAFTLFPKLPAEI